MIKNIAAIALFLISLGASAQSLVVQCKLEIKFTRDGVLENSGVWCSDCRVAITVRENGRKLYLDGVWASAAHWEKSDDKLNSHGFGGLGTWSINSDEISARREIFEYGEKKGYSTLKISRLTGSFYFYKVIENPIGHGNYEERMNGQCLAAKDVLL